jgi:hypothetical protein
VGYTHYFSRPKSLLKRRFNRAANDCKRIVDALVAAEACRVQKERDDPSPPIFTPKLICFNGPGGYGHETFTVAQVYQARPWECPENELYSSFCKTARKPYDLAVCCCLIVLKHYLKEQFLVRSDGRSEFDAGTWLQARKWCHRVLGYGLDFTLDPPTLLL